MKSSFVQQIVKLFNDWLAAYPELSQHQNDHYFLEETWFFPISRVVKPPVSLFGTRFTIFPATRENVIEVIINDAEHALSLRYNSSYKKHVDELAAFYKEAGMQVSLIPPDEV